MLQAISSTGRYTLLLLASFATGCASASHQELPAGDHDGVLADADRALMLTASLSGTLEVRQLRVTLRSLYRCTRCMFDQVVEVPSFVGANLTQAWKTYTAEVSQRFQSPPIMA